MDGTTTSIGVTGVVTTISGRPLVIPTLLGERTVLSENTILGGVQVPNGPVITTTVFA